MPSGVALIDTYYRRGWLSPGKFAAASGFLRDIAATSASRGKPDSRVAALKRLACAKDRLSAEQLSVLMALSLDDEAPGSWARMNGMVERKGLALLRAALERLVPLYVTDGTE